MKTIRSLVLITAILALAASCASSPKKAETAAEPTAEAAAEPAAGLVDLKPFSSASEACRAALAKSVALASDGKWKSAIDALDGFDAQAADPYVLALKTKLLLAGAVDSDALRSFAVIDLEPGQDLETMRISDQDYDLFSFNPVALAEDQAAKGVAAPPILSVTLGDYYYEVLVTSQDMWDISPYEIAAIGAMKYQDAFDGGLFVEESLRRLTELYTGLEMYAEVEPVYRKIIETDPDDPLLHYGLALSLQKRDKLPEMLNELDLTIKAYGDSQDKAGVIALASITAFDLGDKARSEAYLAASDASFAGTSMAGMLRHYVAVNIGDIAATEAVAGKLLDDYGTDFNVARDVVVIWFQNGDPEDLRGFVDQRVAAGGESLTVGNLELLLAMLILQEEMSDQDRAAATAALDDAEKRMKEKLPADDPVFATIDEIRMALSPMLDIFGDEGLSDDPEAAGE